MVPVSVTGRGTVIISGACAATNGRTGSGVAAVTKPAPVRNAAQDARTAAPLLPTEPATISA